MIELILIYSSEVWGYDNLKFIEQIHLKYCKRVLQVRNTTPICMVLGELGKFPIEVKVKLRMIFFWSRLIPKTVQLNLNITPRYEYVPTISGTCPCNEKPKLCRNCFFTENHNFSFINIDL
jgi:hypothetical protein